MKFLLLLSLITLVSSRSTTETSNENARIVGGFQVQSVINYQAALVSVLDNDIFCGGSIIAANWILTAAHCVPDETPQTFYVRVGSLRYDSGGQAVNVQEIISHPNYVDEEYDWDIALLRVDTIQFNDKVYPVELPAENEYPEVAATVMISGWGDLQTDGDHPETLRAVYVQLTSWHQCQVIDEELTQRMICAYANGKDSCQGDSGGPLALENKLVGIVSYGDDCAKPGSPGVYSNIADGDMRAFIREHSGV